MTPPRDRPAPAPRPVAVHSAHPGLIVPRAAVARAIRLLDARVPGRRGQRHPVPAGELSLAFLTDAALAGLHRDFLADPAVTDVITFEGDPAAGAAGEICVSVDAALRFVGRRGGAARLAAELTLYVVHGWLHLAGFDDLTPAEKRRMRAAERRAMAVLAAEGAIPAFRLRVRR